MHRPKERWRVKIRCRWQKEEVWHRGYEQLCLRLYVWKLVRNQLRTPQLCRRILARIPIWHLRWLPQRWLRRFGQQRRAPGRVGTPGRVRYSVRSVPFPSFTSSRSDVRYSTAFHLYTILFLHARFLCRNYSDLYPSANRRPSCLVSIQGKSWILDERVLGLSSFRLISCTSCVSATRRKASRRSSPLNRDGKLPAQSQVVLPCSLTAAAPPSE
jgi:hypothetical protein